MSVKVKDVKAEVIREDDGSYSIACSALGVYGTGKTYKTPKRTISRKSNFIFLF